MTKIVAMLGVALLLIGCQTAVNGPSSIATPVASAEGACAEATQPRCGEKVTFQLSFWDWKTLSPELQQQILGYKGHESNASYAFAKSAVSRDLHPLLIREWQAGGARGIGVPVSATATVPTRGTVNIRATPRASKKNPELTFWDWDRDITVQKVLAAQDPQFLVKAETPPGCQIVYPFSSGRQLSTRTAAQNGENEVQAWLQSSLAQQKVFLRLHLNFIIDCP